MCKTQQAEITGLIDMPSALIGALVKVAERFIRGFNGQKLVYNCAIACEKASQDVDDYSEENYLIRLSRAVLAASNTKS